MDIDDIPQDQSESYGGHKKIIYGTSGGHYQAAASSGWEAEAYATALAVHELDAQTEAARAAVLRGEYSPLYYQMYRARHDVASLAAAAGMWQWQTRRHLRPNVFAKLPVRVLQQYADALNISVEQLKTVRQPETAESPL